mmetsp:Transcript_1162/g.3486  ORF Transcript_1162/g.3486 Transcript_1162/m.3486 type:complete len:265 (+) Transcript_1162:175-969(+)
MARAASWSSRPASRRTRWTRARVLKGSLKRRTRKASSGSGRPGWSSSRSAARKSRQAGALTWKEPNDWSLEMRPRTAPSASRRGPPDMPWPTAASATTKASAAAETTPSAAASVALGRAPGKPQAMANSPMRAGSGRSVAGGAARRSTARKARSASTSRPRSVASAVSPEAVETSRRHPGSATCAAVSTPSLSPARTTMPVPRRVVFRTPRGATTQRLGLIVATAVSTKLRSSCCARRRTRSCRRGGTQTRASTPSARRRRRRI